MNASHSELWLRAIFDSADDAFITIDENGIVQSFNHGAEQMFGYPAGEMTGCGITLLMPEPYSREHPKFLHHYLETGEKRVIGKTQEVVGRRKDGSKIPIELNVSEAFIEGKRLFVGVLRDVSVRKKAEAALRESEARLREIASTLGEGVYVLDRDGLIAFSNPAAQRMLGWAEEELLGQNAHVLFHHSRVDGTPYPEMNCEIGQVVRSGCAFNSRHETFWTRDGAPLPAAVNSTPINRNGEVVGSVVAFHDISGRLESERRLKRQASLYAALSATSEAIIEVREEIVLLREICRIAVEFGGFDLVCVTKIAGPDQILPVVALGRGKANEIVEVHCERQCDSGCVPMNDVLKSGAEVICNDLSAECRTLPGCPQHKREGYLSGGMIPFKCGGKTVGGMGFFTAEKGYFDNEMIGLLRRVGKDVSLALANLELERGRLAAEESLRDLNETLEQRVLAEVARRVENERLLIQQSRLAAMGEMIGNIAHQWRQPLNALALVLANIQDAREFDELDTLTLQGYVRTGRGLIDKMAATIDDFRNFFKPNKQKTSFSVDQQIDHALGLVEGSLKNHSIAVVREKNGAILAEGFPNEFSQVLLNAVMNAKDAFLGHDIVRGVINISVRREGDFAVIDIADNAGGIPAEVLPRIFDPYFTTKEKGTGIGLYMSKMIIENMGGWIDAKNRDGGAVITFGIPCACNFAQIIQ